MGLRATHLRPRPSTHIKLPPVSSHANTRNLRVSFKSKLTTMSLHIPLMPSRLPSNTDQSLSPSRPTNQYSINTPVVSSPPHPAEPPLTTVSLPSVTVSTRPPENTTSSRTPGPPHGESLVTLESVSLMEPVSAVSNPNHLTQSPTEYNDHMYLS